MVHADIPVAVLAALGSAVAYGTAAALQHEQAHQVEERSSLDPALLTSLLTRPVWLVGVGADVAAFVLQATALGFGPVVLVQLLLVAGLPVAVVVSALRARRRLRPREVAGLALCAGGLAASVPGSTLVDPGRSPGTSAVLLAAVAVGVVTAALLALARLRRSVAPVALGTAAGVCAGTMSVMLAVCAGGVGDVAALLHTPAPYLLALFGLLALALSQSAFQTGELAAPWAALSVAEPAVAVLLALVVLHERLPTSQVALVAGVLGAAAAVAGVLVLAAEQRRAG